MRHHRKPYRIRTDGTDQDRSGQFGHENRCDSGLSRLFWLAFIRRLCSTLLNRSRTNVIAVIAAKGTDMKRKINVAVLDALKATGKDYVIGDAEHKGLTVKVSAAGVKTFVFPHRSPSTGKVKTLTIGRYPTLSLADARQAWREARAALDKGGDPVPFVAGATEPAADRMTFGAMIELYDKAHLKTLRRGDDTRSRLRLFGERYGFTDRIANSITPTEAWAALVHMRDAHGPSTAIRTKTLLRTFYKWSRQPQTGYVTNNPFADLGKVAGRGAGRERVLSMDELVAVWKALDDLPALGIGTSPHWAIALKLVFLTGARPGMVVGMERGELRNLDAAQPKIKKVDLQDVASIDTRNFEIMGPFWDVPAKRMKKNRRFLCPLSPMAIALIKAAPGTGKHPIAAPGKDTMNVRTRVNKLPMLTRALYPALGIERFTPHDLRRTAATMLGTFGWTPDKTAMLLAHDKDGVTGKVYDHSKGINEKRAMVLLLEKIITDHVAPTTVVPFKRVA